MASPTQQTWVWVNSGSWWWTGRPGMLRFMGSQRAGHDWATDRKQTSFQSKEREAPWMWSLSHPFPKQWESLLYLKQTGWDLQKFFFNFNHNLFLTHTQLLVGYQELLWNVLSHTFNWGLSLWVGLIHCLFPPIFPFFRIFWLLMFSLEAMSLNFYKNKEIWWWEKKRRLHSGYLLVTHSWIRGGLISAWVFQAVEFSSNI